MPRSVRSSAKPTSSFISQLLSFSACLTISSFWDFEILWNQDIKTNFNFLYFECSSSDQQQYLQNITKYINISSLLLAINHGVHYVAIIYDILHLDPTIDYNFTTLTQNICPSPASLNPHDGMNAINQSLSKKYEGMKPLISRNCLDIRHLIRFNWSISAPVHQHRPVNFTYQIPNSWHNNVLQYILTLI